MLIDTHCHLASHQFEGEEKKSLIARALSVGLDKMISLGSSGADWQDTLAWASEFPKVVYACLGIHPNDILEVRATWREELWALAHQHSLAAIGETGLDYYYPAPEGMGVDDKKFRWMQCEALEAHFDLAARLRLNIVLHTRDKQGQQSFDDAMAIARTYTSKVRPVFHCFIGDKQQATRIFDELDGLISITGIVTFKNAGNVPDVVTWCPEDRFMVETDSPYLSPIPLRGKRNEPSHLAYTAQCIAQLRGWSQERLAQRTSQTAEEFFRL
ncbi:MAG: TatD family hydrolase [Akkermansia sp.]